MYTELCTSRLKLRPALVKDLEQVYIYCGDGENARHMIYLPSESLEETKEALKAAEMEWGKESPGFYEFSVLLGDQVIGSVTLYFLEGNNHIGELGWILNREYWGKGYITEAAEAVIHYAWEIGFKELIALCDSRNRASYRVMEKLGFVRMKEDGIRYNRSEKNVPSVELTYTLSKEP